MSAKKVNLQARIRMADVDEMNGELISSGENLTPVLDLGNPVVSGGVKGIIDQIMKFVSVGGDFV